LKLTQKEGDCKEPFKTDLYKPHEYKGHCLSPPLMPDLDSCPNGEDRKVLADGKTKAVPYP
jgi:hypothetical protein